MALGPHRIVPQERNATYTDNEDVPTIGFTNDFILILEGGEVLRVELKRSYTNDEIIDRVTQGIKENDMTDGNSLAAEITLDIYEGKLRLGVVVSALVPGPEKSFFGKEFFVEI